MYLLFWYMGKYVLYVSYLVLYKIMWMYRASQTVKLKIYPLLAVT